MTRSEKREQAFILVFESNFLKEVEIAEQIEVYNEVHEDEPVCDYAEEILVGVLNHQEELDGIISKFSKGWKISRIPKVNLSILRLALFEMIYVESVPDSVSINEAVELAKKYSSKEDSSFVNGILGSYQRSTK